MQCLFQMSVIFLLINSSHLLNGYLQSGWEMILWDKVCVLHLLGSSFLLFTLMNLECPHLAFLTKRGWLRATWTQRRSELGRFPVPSPRRQPGTKVSCGFSGEVAAAPCLSPLSWSHYWGGLEKRRSAEERSPSQCSDTSWHLPAEDLWTEEMILMFGSDPKKTLCMKGNQNRNPGQLAQASSTPVGKCLLGVFRH